MSEGKRGLKEKSGFGSFLKSAILSKIHKTSKRIKPFAFLPQKI